MRTFRWTDFDLPSTLKLAPLEKILLEPVSKIGKKLERIKLGLHEALVNAVVHGNKRDFSKRIRVRRIVTPNWFVWQIQDQGNGTPRDARVSALPSQIEAESGRGFFLIHECFDDVRWSHRGNRIQVACKRT